MIVHWSNPVIKGNQFNDFSAWPDKIVFPNFLKVLWLLALLGSTYVCKQIFMIIEIHKDCPISKLIDWHLRSIVTIATTNKTWDFDAMVEKGAWQHFYQQNRKWLSLLSCKCVVRFVKYMPLKLVSCIWFPFGSYQRLDKQPVHAFALHWWMGLRDSFI